MTGFRSSRIVDQPRDFLYFRSGQDRRKVFAFDIYFRIPERSLQGGNDLWFRLKPCIAHIARHRLHRHPGGFHGTNELPNRTPCGEHIIRDNDLSSMNQVAEFPRVQNFIVSWMENPSVFLDILGLFCVLRQEKLISIKNCSTCFFCQFFRQPGWERVLSTGTWLRDEHRIGRINQLRLDGFRLFGSPMPFRETSRRFDVALFFGRKPIRILFEDM
ncbi:MAG: hypothetical protein HQL95_00675 [Magnetococcales bacterium]|nr:hypothetical protein [Magnetococcales bacterium]